MIILLSHWLAIVLQLDYGFDRVMTFDTSKTIIVGKPVQDPSIPCGCNCYEVTVNN